MIPYHPIRTLLHLPQIVIGSFVYPETWLVSFPFFLGLAFIVLLVIALYEAKKRKLDRKTIFLMWATSVIAGLIGAKLMFAILWEGISFESLKHFLNPLQGGIASSGAFIAMFITVFIYSRFSKKNIWVYLDMFGIAGGVAFAIGRLACFFAGCCYGKVADLPWSVYYIDALRHPVQLYEIICSLGIYVYMQRIKNRKRYPGYLFLLFILLYSFARFFIEFMREGPMLGPFSYSQYLYAAIFIGVLLMMRYRQRMQKTWRSRK
jgi:phosphatidylglycerol---prolipoprotein diacylglyceryl transferase